MLPLGRSALHIGPGAEAASEWFETQIPNQESLWEEPNQHVCRVGIVPRVKRFPRAGFLNLCRGTPFIVSKGAGYPRQLV